MKKIIHRLKKLNQKRNLRFRLNKKSILWSLYAGDMFEIIKDVEGAVVECGVGRGNTLQALLVLAEKQDRNLWGFDSFDSYPDMTEEDISIHSIKNFNWKKININKVWKLINYTGLSVKYLPKVKLVEGYFKDVLPDNNIDKIALLHLSCDLYESYMDCFKYLYSQVEKGGVIMFDQYEGDPRSLKWSGAKKAVDKFFEGKEILRNDYSGKYYIVK